jgi:large subunit ribosomal protein L21
MYAVIKTGGKQHKVAAGDQLRVELVEGKPGDKVTFEPLLVVDDDGGTHFGKDAAGAVVTAKLLGEVKGRKIRVFKYRPKSGYSRRQGHRQQLALLEVESVELKKSRPKKAGTAEAASGKDGTKAASKPAAKKGAGPAKKPGT